MAQILTTSSCKKAANGMLRFCIQAAQLVVQAQHMILEDDVHIRVLQVQSLIKVVSWEHLLG